MPQNPIFPRFGGNASVLNVTAPTVIKALPGTLWTVSVTTAGTTAGSVHDCSTVAAAAVANLTYAIPDVAGIYELNFPHFAGIVVTPGTGQVLSVAFA